MRWWPVILLLCCMVAHVSAIAGEQWRLVNQSAEFPARQEPLLTVFDGKLWLLGGEKLIIIPPATTSYKVFNDTWYTEDGNIWHLVNASPEFLPRWDSHLVTFDNKMWLIGGYTADGNSPVDVWYSDDGNIWRLANESVTPVPRDEYGVLVYDGKMWIIGGYDWDSGSMLPDVWSSSDGIIWTNVTYGDANGPRVAYSKLPIIVFDNKMWVMGGEDWDQGFVYYDTRSSTDGSTWTMVGTNLTVSGRGQEYPFATYDAGTKVIGYKESSGVWSTSDMITWSLMNDTPQFNTHDFVNFGQYNYVVEWPSMIEYNGKLWMIGGIAHSVNNLYDAINLNSTWYTDNLTYPSEGLPVCSDPFGILTSISAALVMASIGIVIFGASIVILVMRGGIK